MNEQQASFSHSPYEQSIVSKDALGQLRITIDQLTTFLQKLMRNSVRLPIDDDRRKVMNVRRSLLYNIIVKDNNLKSLKLGNVNFESEMAETNEEQLKIIESEDSFAKLAQEQMISDTGQSNIDQAQRRNIDKATEKVLDTIRMSYQVQVQNLTTRFKTLLKEILERRLMELRRKFEFETKQVMNQFFDLKASLYEKETRLKTLQVQICDLEGKHTQQKQSAESQLAAMQRRINMVPKGDNSLKEHVQSLQLENESQKEEIDAFRKEIDRLRTELENERNETSRLKVVEQLKVENDRRLNETTLLLRENEKKFQKLQTTVKLTSPKKFKMDNSYGKESRDIMNEVSSTLAKGDQDMDEIQRSKQQLAKLLEAKLKQEILSSAQFRKLKDELKSLKDYIAELERKIQEQEIKMQNSTYPPQFRERLDDIILNSCVSVSRPSTSVNYYYEAPSFNLATQFQSKPASRANSVFNEEPQQLDFKLERLLTKQLKQRSPDPKRTYQYDSQGFVTKAEKTMQASPLPESQVFIEVKRLKASPLNVSNLSERDSIHNVKEDRKIKTRQKFKRYRLTHIQKPSDPFS